MTSIPRAERALGRRAPRFSLNFFLLSGIVLCAALRPASTGAQVTLTDIKMDVLSAVQNQAATLTSSPFDLGNISQIFDGRTNTLARTPNINPAFVQISFTQVRTLTRFRVYLSYGTSYQWWVEKADTQADMDAHTGSYAVITGTNSVLSWNYGQQVVAPTTAKLFRLNVRRIGGDGYCHINEWELFGNVDVDRLELSPESASLYYGQSQQFHVLGYNSLLGEGYDVDALAQWTLNGAIGTLSPTGLFTAGNPGQGTVTATVGSLTSPPATIIVQQSDPDVDVLYIERTPRLAFDPANTAYTSGLPAPGQQVVYRAHVKNWGTTPVTVPYEWWFDDSLSLTGSVSILPGQEITVGFPFAWQTNTHQLEFRADPANSLFESSKLNNRVKIRTDALLVGLWVEQGLYNYFHQSQIALKDGANGFEDWGQRMVNRWNYYFEKAKFPVCPNGFLDRVALDQVIVVPDGALPLAGGLAGNNPDSRDRTVDMQWGYSWNPAETNSGQFYMFRWNGPFFIDFGSIHEMNHARYHIDLYALDENHNASSPNVPLIDDDTGLPVVGTSKMPFIAWDVVYYNKWRDIMGAGPPVFDAYSAGAWNWKHHRRGQGNQNSPPDLGKFLNDLPLTNHVQFIDQQGVPLAGAEVWVYRTSGGFYSKVFNNTPAGYYVADANGSVRLGRNPFGATADFSYSSPIIIFKVRYRGQLYFMFQEVTDFNIQNWLRAGVKQQAKEGFYVREIDLRDNGWAIPNGGWIGNYFNSDAPASVIFTRTEGAATGLNFTWSGSPAAGVNPTNFTVYWQGGISFTDGWKQFRITSDGGLQLLVDGRLVFDQWTNGVLQTWSPIIYTSASAPFVNPGRSSAYGAYHRVEVRYQHQGTNPARVELAWLDEPPPSEVPVNAWRGDYYSRRTLTGYLLSRTETAIDFNYGQASPDPVVGSDDFSVRWTGDWDFPGGNVTFRAVPDDGIRVRIDGALLLDKWFDQPPTQYTFSRSMSPGRHRIQVEYYEGGGGAQAIFGWNLPPWIRQAPGDQTVMEGATVTFAGSASGYPGPNYQWLFNKVLVAPGPSSTLTLTNVQTSHSGTYTFVATNAFGTVSADAKLTVVPPAAVPVLAAQPGQGTGEPFQLLLSGLAGWAYRVETSTNLLRWDLMTNVAYTGTPILLADPGSTNYSARFFRAAVSSGP